MLEIAVVAWLCWRNGRTVRRSGHSQRRYWLITLGLLFAGVNGGVIVGSILIGGPHTPQWAEYAFTWGGLALGGAASYLIANRAARAPVVVVASAPWEPTHWSPEGGLDITDAPESREPVVGVILGRRLVAVDEWAGDRAHVTTADGSQGWVDGGGLDAFDSHRRDEVE
ncbi:MAG: hypothetical protein ABSE70_06435 [Candidatus Limnocylindrales bacterium]